METIWTEEQVKNLNDRQALKNYHPYTCGNPECRAILVATPHGWVCPNCEYMQGWAHQQDVTGATVASARRREQQGGWPLN